MKWRRLFLAAVVPVLGLAVLRAQETTTPAEPVAPTISTTASQSYPQVACTTSDMVASADTLQLAEDARDRLAPLLDLGSTWRFPVDIHILTPDDPLSAKVNHEASAVFAQGTTMKIEAVLPSSDPEAREFIQRQFVKALLWEKFFAATKTFDRQTQLDVVPVWLVEGLREYLNDDPEHNRESVVRRCVQNQSAPTLNEVTHWQELSDDQLLGMWQRSFCYYLVDSLTRQGAQRDDFQQWLAGFSSPSSTSAQLHFPTEEAWQRELADATSRSHDVVYTWDETASEWAADETVTYASSRDGKVQTCTIDDVLTLPHDPIVVEALQERIFVLTQLELRAHPGWHSILELYRSALTALVHDSDSVKAGKLLSEARRERMDETAYHQKLLDYVNWFEVTKDYGDTTSPFRSYFTTAQELERAQADPAHPNPIRASLLQIESEL
jgi:hypothetical protein